MHSQSSSVYTFQKPTQAKRRYAASTIAIGVLSLAGALGIDYWLNPTAMAAMFNTSGVSTNGTVQSATGDSVESGFGPVQVKVTRDSGNITAVELVQAVATGGRESAFTTLVQAALDANGTGFGNISGATYTTEAFKASLDSALSKLG
ncbi:MAG: hypothetical protein RLZ53_271 [Actinomycetota bacterium]|jgi:uncharacterized protein with FMN-binding domain